MRDHLDHRKLFLETQVPRPPPRELSASKFGVGQVELAGPKQGPRGERGSSPLTPLPSSKRGKEKKKEVQKLHSGTVVCNCYQTFEKQETTKK